MKFSKIFGWGAAMGILSVFAVSCDREKEAVEGVPGKMVEVHVRILGVRAGQSEEVMRSATLSTSTGKQEIARSSQAIGDGMVLDMSLEPDESAPLRAATPVPLEDGKTFRVIALNTATGKYVSHADFTIVNGSSNTDASLHVLEGVSHVFVCLSHNDNVSTGGLFSATYALDALPNALPVPTNDKDLLYAKTTATITSSNRNISFLLEHKLSKVTVVLDGTYNSWSVSNVSSGICLQPFYDQAQVDLQSGGVTKGASSTTQYFEGWTSGTYTQTSAPRTIFTNGEDISLILPANAAYMGSIGYRPSVQKTVTFSGLSSLVAGNSYTLRVRMRSPMWAGSNVYWVWNDATNHNLNGYLTFDPVGTTTHEGYQGLFFKFRGVWGVSPVGTTFTITTHVFSADVAGNRGNWSQVYMTGDICTIKAGYRLPREEDFGSANITDWNSPQGGWVREGASTLRTSDKVEGTYDLKNTVNGCRVRNTLMGNVSFPASSRRGTDGTLDNMVGYSGYYWCTPPTGTIPRFMSFDWNGLSANNIAPDISYREYGFSVRCVMD